MYIQEKAACRPRLYKSLLMNDWLGKNDYYRCCNRKNLLNNVDLCFFVENMDQLNTDLLLVWSAFLAKTTHWPSSGLMLGQRLWRWPNISPSLGYVRVLVVRGLVRGWLGRGDRLWQVTAEASTLFMFTLIQYLSAKLLVLAARMRDEWVNRASRRLQWIVAVSREIPKS